MLQIYAHSMLKSGVVLSTVPELASIESFLPRIYYKA